jgi:Protein of unknown function (DUF732)
MNHRLTTFADAAVAAAALGVGGFAAAGTASAGTVDDAFLADIYSAGITYTSPQAALANAQAVCEELGSGQSVGAIGSQILANTNLTTSRAAVFIVDSLPAYCPRYSGALGA